MNKKGTTRCFRCGKTAGVIITTIREKRPELCRNCLNYIYNFEPLPVLTVNKEDNNNDR